MKTSVHSWTEKLQSTSQSQIRTKKGRGHCLAACCPFTTAFWILTKPLHLRSMLSKSMRCTQNCNACSWHWSPESAQFLTTPNCTLHNQCFKSWTNWAMKFCLIYLTSSQLTTTSSSTFLQGKCFHSQQEAENAFQEFVESQSMDFYTTGINKLVSCWQNGVDCNGSYFN